MSKPEQPAEPSMEDILASIRRAITDEPAPPGARRQSAGGTSRGWDAGEERPRPVPAAGDRSDRLPDTTATTELDFAVPGKGDAPKTAPAALPPPQADDVAARPLPLGESALDRGDVLDLKRVAREPIAPAPPRPLAPPAGQSGPGESFPGFASILNSELKAAEARRAAVPPVRSPLWPPSDLASAPRAPAPPAAGEFGLLSPEANATAAAAFSRLAGSLMFRPGNERTIEDLVKELLKPMLKGWLDEHLPALVERLVREEIQRVARGGR